MAETLEQARAAYMRGEKVICRKGDLETVVGEWCRVGGDILRLDGRGWQELSDDTLVNVSCSNGIDFVNLERG